MPISDRLRRPRRRLAAATAASAAIGVVALGAPTSASAYDQHFCQYVTLPSGSHCAAGTQHTLDQVQGWSIGSTERVCTASFTSQWGSLNSDWRCDYGTVTKYLGDRVGVGAIRNGDPQTFVGYAVQRFGL